MSIIKESQKSFLCISFFILQIWLCFLYSFFSLLSKWLVFVRFLALYFFKKNKSLSTQSTSQGCDEENGGVRRPTFINNIIRTLDIYISKVPFISIFPQDMCLQIGQELQFLKYTFTIRFSLSMSMNDNTFFKKNIRIYCTYT